MAFIIIYEPTSKGSHFHPGNLTYVFLYPHMHIDDITVLSYYSGEQEAMSSRCHYGQHQASYLVSEKVKRPEGPIPRPLSSPRT